MSRGRLLPVMEAGEWPGDGLAPDDGAALLVQSVPVAPHGDALHPGHLMQDARALVASVPMLAHFEARLGAEANRVWAALAGCSMSSAILLRLDVARDNRDGSYERAVRAAFIALFIGASAGFPEPELEALATAALLLDVGLMRGGVAAAHEHGPLSLNERRRLQQHPITGQRIALGELAMDPVIATAIAQHHERIDGSGYPHGFRGAAISPLARILMLAEIVLSVLDSADDAPALQLSMILRVNRASLDTRLAEVLLAALPGTQLPPNAALYRSELRRAGTLLAAWREMAGVEPLGDGGLFAFVNERMERLQALLADAPISLDLSAPGEQAAAQLCAEMGALGREVLWHARQIAFDAVQRWPDALSTGPIALQSQAGAWVSAAMTLSERRRNVLAL
jgi:hypothetical protein